MQNNGRIKPQFRALCEINKPNHHVSFSCNSQCLKLAQAVNMTDVMQPLNGLCKWLLKRVGIIVPLSATGTYCVARRTYE